MTSRRLTTLIEDVEFNAEALAVQYDNDCQWLVALSDWQISVILSALRYAEWQSRWQLGSHTWDEIEAQISQLEYCLMAGCNVGELLDKFDTLNGYMMTLVSRFVTPEGANIAEVTEDQEIMAVCSPDVNVTCGGGGCGGGGGVGGSGGESGSDIIEQPGNTQQSGYSADYKCKAANFIVDFIIETCNGLSTITGLAFTVYEALTTTIGIVAGVPAVLGALGITAIIFTIPEWAVIALIAMVAGLLASFGATAIMALLGRIATELETNRADVICGLYNSSNTDEAKTVLDDFFNDAIDVVTVDAVPGCGEWTQDKIDQSQYWLINLITYFSTTNLLNLLFPQTEDDQTEEITNYTATTPCIDCSDEGVFDFTIDEQDWLIDEVVSVNGEYDDVNNYFWGHVEGTGTAILKIYYPTEPVTINTLRMWVYGTGQEIDIINILTADDVEGEWANAYTQVDVSTPGLEPGGFTIVEFTDLNITNKYIGIYLNRFWAGAAVDIQRVEWE